MVRAKDSKPLRAWVQFPPGVQKGKIMEDNVQKELDIIETMVCRWKKNHMSFVTGKNDDFLVEEFLEEVGTTHVYSYACRLCEAGHITHQELSEFMGRCYEHVVELKEMIDKVRK